jgi:hypothetical protein
MTSETQPIQLASRIPHTRFAAQLGALVLALALTAGCASSAPPPAQSPAPAPTLQTPPAQPTQAVPTVVQTVVTRVDPTPNADMISSLPQLPRPSPNAEVAQDVGITQVRVTYSSPGVKGRTIWGELVPYGELWRTGANAPTKLIVNRDFTFAGVAVPAGSYSLMTIPKQGAWTVILNQDPTNQGAFARDTKQDVAVVELTPVQAPVRERLAFAFEGTTDNQTALVLDWAGVRLAMPIGVNTDAHVAASISSTLEAAWRPLFNAGRYAFSSGDNVRAIQLLNQSLSVRETWWSHWWLAQVYAKQNQVPQARQHAQKAMELGEGDEIFQRAFAADVKKAMEGWPQS